MLCNNIKYIIAIISFSNSTVFFVNTAIQINMTIKSYILNKYSLYNYTLLGRIRKQRTFSSFWLQHFCEKSCHFLSCKISDLNIRKIWFFLLMAILDIFSNDSYGQSNENSCSNFFPVNFNKNKCLRLKCQKFYNV